MNHKGVNDVMIFHTIIYKFNNRGTNLHNKNNNGIHAT